MKRLRTFPPPVLVSIVFLSSLLAHPPQGPEAREILGLLPSLSDMPEWSIAEGPIFYEPDDLFHYLNGGAPQYHSYGFRTLAHIRLCFRGDDLSCVTLDIFDMESNLGAYGIYSSVRPQEAEFQPWGVQGYRSGTVGAAWKQAVYVHASADDDRADLVRMLEFLLRDVTSRVNGPSELPDLVAALPESGFIPNSDRYVGKDLLGHSFLPGGMLARYRMGPLGAMLFFCGTESSEKAAETLGRLRSYEQDRGELLDDETEVGDEGFQANDPGMGRGLIVRAGAYVAGIWSEADRQELRRVLGDLVVRLRRLERRSVE